MEKSIYLDHNASTAPNKKILQKTFYIISNPANPSSTHSLGQKMSQIIENSRNNIKKFLNCNNEYNCYFTSSCTEANNLIMKGLVGYKKIISSIEHLSIINSAQNAIKISVTQNGIIDINELERELSNNANNKILVSIMLANNVTGVIQPIKEIVQIAKKYNAIVHTDVAQGVGKIKVNFENLGSDAITLSAHKFGGIKGCGALIVKNNIDISPIITGGPQEFNIRAGTENTGAIYNIGEAITHVDELLKKMQQTMKLRDYMENKIMSFAKNAVIIGKNSQRLPNTSCISMPNVHKSIQVAYFDMNGISVGLGSACSSGSIKPSYVLSKMNIPDETANNTIRVSMWPTNTKKEIDIFIEKWKELYEKNNKNT